jgi:hypothetical protein
MRFGKCFVTYKVAKEVGYKRILILTYKPSGVEESWEEDEATAREIQLVRDEYANGEYTTFEQYLSNQRK